MRYVIELPPGQWRSAADEAEWEEILDWHASIGDQYRQQVYLALTDPKFAARMAHPAYRARIEREHKERCDRVDAAARSHLDRSYTPEGGVWDADFEFRWVPEAE